MKTFITHTGESVVGSRLQAALTKVANDWRTLARAIHKGNDWASHVTQAQKDARLTIDLETADEVEAGEIKSFTMWQRVNTELTGQCVALLSKGA